MRYVVIESFAYSVASCRGACLRLTYEVRPLRDGVESWFLVCTEEMPTLGASNLT